MKGRPAFAHPVTTGQYHVPPWERVEEALRGIFARHYFANNGPLVRSLDDALAKRFGFGHAVCATNEVTATMIAVRALELTGEVVLPALSPRGLADGLRWGGVTPVFCDVEFDTGMVTAQTVRPHLSERTTGIAVSDAFGEAQLAGPLEAAAGALKLMIASWRGVGGVRNPPLTAGAAIILSFHESALLNGSEGGCVLTNDDALAAKLKTIRNFHPSETFAPVRLRMNGKMSEAQAALVLLSLEELDATVAENAARYAAYARGLSGLPGIRLHAYDPQRKNDYCTAVIDVDDRECGITTDALCAYLAGQNVLCARPQPLTGGLPASERLARRLLELPNGSALSTADVNIICELIAAAARGTVPA